MDGPIEVEKSLELAPVVVSSTSTSTLATKELKKTYKKARLELKLKNQSFECRQTNLATVYEKLACKKIGCDNRLKKCFDFNGVHHYVDLQEICL